MIRNLKIYFILLFVASNYAYASTGVSEFQLDTDYSSYRIINDANKMVAIDLTSKNSKNPLGKCGQYPLENSRTQFKGKSIIFLKDYALVDNVKYSYLEKKTDIYPYYGICL